MTRGTRGSILRHENGCHDVVHPEHIGREVRAARPAPTMVHVTRDARPRTRVHARRLTQLLSVCAEQPILDAIEVMAVHCEACSPPCPYAIRTARSRTAGENQNSLAMTRTSRTLEPPELPVRFSLSLEFTRGRKRAKLVQAFGCNVGFGVGRTLCCSL
jgi:hypothetical protein